MKVWWQFSDGFEFEKNLTTNDGVEIMRRGQKVSMLSIEAVKARHRGNYTCRAQNKAGTAMQSAQLAINGDLGDLRKLLMSSHVALRKF